MEFFDTAVNKVKDVFGVAYKKTEEVVTTQKQKIDIASMENKLSKEYEKLGKLYYDNIKNENIVEGELKDIVDVISAKITEIDAAKAELAKSKSKRLCPVCSEPIDISSNFCNHCGAKLTFEETEE